MSIYKGTELLSGIATNTVSNAHDLFDFKWSDHLLNDQNWLRADTNSWQDGTVYTEAYQHLADDYANGTDVTETIGSYTITYRLAPDGHKIVFYNQSSVVDNIYNESGVAWYYMYDPNQKRARFKLPRSSHGNIVEKGYTSSGWYRVWSDGWCEQGGVSKTGTWGRTTVSLPKAYDDATYNLTIGAEISDANSYTSTATLTNRGATRAFWHYKLASSFQCQGYDYVYWRTCGYIQSYPTNDQYKYLYFYVGQFSQTATEQTAGLNSELFNGKVDLDAANLSTAGKSLISGLGMPSDRYDNLTLGASGTSYTAPANGYFAVSKYANGANQFLGMYNSTNKIALFWNNPANGNLLEQFLPVKKGDVITINYNLGGNTQRFIFIYAEGEENV